MLSKIKTVSELISYLENNIKLNQNTKVITKDLKDIKEFKNY